MFRTLSVSAVKGTVTRKVHARKEYSRVYSQMLSARDEAVDATLYDSDSDLIHKRDAACCAVFILVDSYIPLMLGTSWAKEHLPFELHLAQIWLRKAHTAIASPKIRDALIHACASIIHKCEHYGIAPETI